MAKQEQPGSIVYVWRTSKYAVVKVGKSDLSTLLFRFKQEKGFWEALFRNVPIIPVGAAQSKKGKSAKQMHVAIAKKFGFSADLAHTKKLSKLLDKIDRPMDCCPKRMLRSWILVIWVIWSVFSSVRLVQLVRLMCTQ